ncbi:MAG: methyltransferase [Rhodobacteraceae bacterium]|nr:methyltransferase [Paracoccaceae bacterium]
MIDDPKAFIRKETCIKPVPHAEEIRLYVADEAMDLWQKTEDELGELGLDPPFWAFAWAGGQALARHILDLPELVKDKRVLDLASGSGLVGIATMMAGAQSCHAVDIDPFAISAGELNAELNDVVINFEARDVTGDPPPQVDVLFCGDVFYDDHMAKKILDYLDRCLLAGITIFVGDPGRSYLPKTRLEHLATYEVPVVGALEDAEIKKSSVYRLLVPS